MTLEASLRSKEALTDLIISGGFAGQKILLTDIATILDGFEKANQVYKIDGREGILLNVKKSATTDILTAKKAVDEVIEAFQQSEADLPVGVITMDDESYDIRNRIELIVNNGILGFLLILGVLFLFLDFKSGFWVAMGLPFALAFTLLITTALGYTVNNITLAAVIVVLGIVVDDAIIVSENIKRRRKESPHEPATKAAEEVFWAIFASILTTAIAFLPLFFISGRFGQFVAPIPLVIMLMLGASLLESFFILPCHIATQSKVFARFQLTRLNAKREALTQTLEQVYQRGLVFILKFRYLILLVFFLGLAAVLTQGSKTLKYVMFPKEEVRHFRIQAEAEPGVKRYEMAKRLAPVEQMFLDHPLVTAVYTTIGENRWGREAYENEARLRIEILPPTEREISFEVLASQWTEKMKEFPGFTKLDIRRHRFGTDSGSQIAIEIGENQDQRREEVAQQLKAELLAMQELEGVEIKSPPTHFEFRLHIDKEAATKLEVAYSDLAQALRTYLDGQVLSTIIEDEEIDLRLLSNEDHATSVADLLALSVANKKGYLIPLNRLVTATPSEKPVHIQRTNFKRSVMVYSDIKPDSPKTPLDIAKEIEQKIIPKVLSGRPSTQIHFRGEIEDSRRSRSEFGFAISVVVVLIYVLLVFLFNSLITPLLIAVIIPFGLIGTILAYWLHMRVEFGFFAVVGILGMMGVVVNDAIVMVDRFRRKLRFYDTKEDLFRMIATTASERLRAIILTTLTTVCGLMPTAYGLGGYDSMLSEMMFSMAYGLIFGMAITLLLLPCLYSVYAQFAYRKPRGLS